MFNLTINSTNVANSLNNMYQYQFKNGAFEVPANAEMMITSFMLLYSWYNITTRYNNNSFKIYWPSPIVNSVTVTNGGSGYTAVPTVVFTGTNTTIATATAVLTPTSVASLTVTAAGSGYTTAPTVVFTGGNGTGAIATPVFTATTIASIAVSAGGTGYTSVPTVVFTGGGGTLAAGTAVLTAGVVTSVTMTNAGSGYTTLPIISFTGGGGSGAVATAVVTATTIASITVTNGGSGYTSAPTISFTGGAGSGTTATAVITPTSVASLTIVGGGTGYAAAPTISFTGGGGSGAAVTTSLYIPFTLTLDDGFYTVNALNARIQQFCIEKGMYLTDGSGNNVYYLSITPNSTAYANQIITKLIPLTVTGFTAPSNFAGYATTTKRTPYVEILSNNFGKYLGFTTGNYGKDQIADYNVLSNLIPQGTTVNTLLVKCSLVNNGCSNQSDILDAFAIGGSSGGTFGGNLNYTNNIEKWVRISEGRYNNFIVTIVDQNNNEISILDNNLLINFLIRVK